jgi:hypothetical protein
VRCPHGESPRCVCDRTETAGPGHPQKCVAANRHLRAAARRVRSRRERPQRVITIGHACPGGRGALPDGNLPGRPGDGAPCLRAPRRGAASRAHRQPDLELRPRPGVARADAWIVILNCASPRLLQRIHAGGRPVCEIGHDYGEPAIGDVTRHIADPRAAPYNLRAAPQMILRESTGHRDELGLRELLGTASSRSRSSPSRKKSSDFQGRARRVPARESEAPRESTACVSRASLASTSCRARRRW